MQKFPITKCTANVVRNETFNTVVIEHNQFIYCATYDETCPEYEATNDFLNNFFTVSLSNENKVMLVFGTNGMVLALIHEKPVFKLANDNYQFITEYSVNIIEGNLILRYGNNFYGRVPINDDLKALLIGYIESVMLSNENNTLNVMIQDYSECLNLEHLGDSPYALIDNMVVFNTEGTERTESKKEINNYIVTNIENISDHVIMLPRLNEHIDNIKIKVIVDNELTTSTTTTQVCEPKEEPKEITKEEPNEPTKEVTKEVTNEVTKEEPKETSTKVVQADGTVCYVNAEGLFHRENDLPAKIFTNGDKYYMIDGKLHREIEPAVEHANGLCVYYLNGKFIRLVLPKF